MDTVRQIVRSEQASTSGSAGGTLPLLGVWLLGTMGLWFFAFYSMPGEAPDWVRRAQVACFGSSDNGMPNAAGWMLLILSPAALLGALFVALGGEIRSALRRLANEPSGLRLLVIIGSVVVAQGAWVTRSIAARVQLPSSESAIDQRSALPAGYARGRTPAPDFSLVDQSGAAVTLSSLRGKPVLLSFVFAHCQTVCPSLVTTINGAVSEIGPEKVVGLMITLDPWRDTPGTLPGLAQRWKLPAGVSILTGAPDQVNMVLDNYGVPRDRSEKSGDVVHPALVQVISPAGEIAYSFNNPSRAWLREAVDLVSK